MNRGYWLHCNDDHYDWWECSICRYGFRGEINSEEKTTNYCPNCGTDMRGKDMANFENLIKLADKEKVNHPLYYNREDAIECIDEMILIFGKEAVKNFCLCNVWKYRYRAADKNGEIDLEKSDWYMAKYKELLVGKTTSKEEKEEDMDTIIEWNPMDKGYHVRTVPLGHKK